MTNQIIIVIASVSGLILGIISGITYRKKVSESTIGTAEKYAKTIVETAEKETESMVKDAKSEAKEIVLEAKESSIKMKTEIESEIKERRKEIKKDEDRLKQKDETLEKKTERLDKKSEVVQFKLESIEVQKKEVEKLILKEKESLEKIAMLTREEAKESLLEEVNKEIKDDVARIIRKGEEDIKETLDKKSKNLLTMAVQKCSLDHVTEMSVSVVKLPNDEMKGRIIGREGRNIRTLESLTGVDFIVDDMPEIVTLSCFDPMRREIAKIALEKLVLDGRVQPSKIEEMVNKAKKEVDELIKADGERAIIETGIRGVHPEIIKLVGKMRFRTSYGQNILKHSIEVANICGVMAGELGLDINLAKKAGLLHDIGKALDYEMEGSHVEIGAAVLRKYKESKIVINAVESHHGDVEPIDLIPIIAQVADAISASRTGARRETIENYTKRLKDIERITESFEGVDKSFVIQAGREVRAIIVPEKVSDSEMIILARKISNKIEEELEYPGQVKVNLIKEVRAIDYAK